MGVSAALRTLHDEGASVTLRWPLHRQQTGAQPLASQCKQCRRTQAHHRYRGPGSPHRQQAGAQQRHARSCSAGKSISMQNTCRSGAQPAPAACGRAAAECASMQCKNLKPKSMVMPKTCGSGAQPAPAADGRAAAECASMQRRKSAQTGDVLGGSGRMWCSAIARLISAFSRPSNGRWPAHREPLRSRPSLECSELCAQACV